MKKKKRKKKRSGKGNRAIRVNGWARWRGDGEGRAVNDPCNDFLQFRATCGNLFPTRYGADVVRIKSSVRPRSCLEWKTTSAIVPPTSQRGSSIRHLVHDARNDGWRRAFAEIVPRFSHRDRTYVLELPINREILRYFPSSTYRRLVTRCIEIEKHDRLHYFLPRESTKRFGYLVANDRMKIFHFNQRMSNCAVC